MSRSIKRLCAFPRCCGCGAVAALFLFVAPAMGVAAEQKSGARPVNSAAAKAEQTRLDRIAALSWESPSPATPLVAVPDPSAQSPRPEFLVPAPTLVAPSVKKKSAVSWSVTLDSPSPDARMRFDDSYRYGDFLRGKDRGKEQNKDLAPFTEDALPVQEVKLGMHLAF